MTIAAYHNVKSLASISVPVTSDSPASDEINRHVVCGAFLSTAPGAALTVKVWDGDTGYHTMYDVAGDAVTLPNVAGYVALDPATFVGVRRMKLSGASSALTVTLWGRPLL